MKVAEKWAAAIGEHEEMISALEARDKARLSEVLGRHLSNAWDGSARRCNADQLSGGTFGVRFPV